MDKFLHEVEKNDLCLSFLKDLNQNWLIPEIQEFLLLSAWSKHSSLLVATYITFAIHDKVTIMFCPWLCSPKLHLTATLPLLFEEDMFWYLHSFSTLAVKVTPTNASACLNTQLSEWRMATKPWGMIACRGFMAFLYIPACLWRLCEGHITCISLTEVIQPKGAGIHNYLLKSKLRWPRAGLSNSNSMC